MSPSSPSYQKEERRTHCVLYDLAWTTSRCTPVLIDDIAKETSRLIREHCDTRGWTVHRLDVRPNYVHLLVQVWPSVSPANVVRALRRATAGPLLRLFPSLRSLPSMWTYGYFAATQGSVTPEDITAFVLSQTPTPRRGD